ncbi:hypothetical protein OW495_21020 [Vibrio sp. 14N.309.X.WAT.E.F5]|uniref:hypothetical protein n=1 Tax=Vibrio TaxID=662 RepID=UPI000C8310F5|nr:MULTISPECIES: hypothetical protein [Vibrio]MCF7493908.1 hypothetical protein [Vibrio sp. L5-1]MDN2669213.1 hypothetical protein [Vibrio sp. 14N.309.X.WAT.E.F5]NOI91495.1 hypothetical protein [Vibrio splendidus]PMJ88224.1 hypothetical protein BCU13_07475 [Vibrio lentus]
MELNMSLLGGVLFAISSAVVADTQPLQQQPEEKLKVKTDLLGNEVLDTNINDDSNFIGDRISFPLITPLEGELNCSIPPGITMKALGLNADQDLVLFTQNEKIECYQPPSSTQSPTYIPAYEKLLVDKDNRVGMHRFGLTYGGLIVPYKYLTSAKEFRGGTSIAPYVGYRFDPSSYGYGMKLVGFFGATTVDVEGNDSSSLGVTYGIGLLGQIKGSFQLGLVFGADQVGESENYEFNKKPWVALSLGYDFSN